MTYLQVDEKQLKTKDTVNKRLGVLGKEFIIDLQYLLNAKAAKSVDIFYFSDDNEFIVKFVVDKKELKLSFHVHLNGVMENILKLTIKAGKYIKIRIQQIQTQDGSYTFSIYKDNVSKYKMEAVNARPFFGVNVRAPPKENGVAGWIKEFVIYRKY